MKYDDDIKESPMPIALQVAWFQHFYPGQYSRPDYPTSDRVIPFKLFRLMYAASLATVAFTRLNSALAVAMGKNIVENPNRTQVNQMLNTLTKESRGDF